MLISKWKCKGIFFKDITMENDILHIKIKPDGLNLQPCGNEPVKAISSWTKNVRTKLMIIWLSDYMDTHKVNNKRKYNYEKMKIMYFDRCLWKYA